MKTFIRAKAVRGTAACNPWVVNEDLVKKYSLPSKFADFFVSPAKVSGLVGLSVLLSGVSGRYSVFILVVDG